MLCFHIELRGEPLGQFWIDMLVKPEGHRVLGGTALCTDQMRMTDALSGKLQTRLDILNFEIGQLFNDF